jgi:hypothetical protein
MHATCQSGMPVVGCAKRKFPRTPRSTFDVDAVTFGPADFWLPRNARQPADLCRSRDLASPYRQPVHWIGRSQQSGHVRGMHFRFARHELKCSKRRKSLPKAPRERWDACGVRALINDFVASIVLCRQVFSAIQSSMKVHNFQPLVLQHRRAHPRRGSRKALRIEPAPRTCR